MPVTAVCRRILILALLLHIVPVCGSDVMFIVTADLHGRLDRLAKLAPVICRYPEAVKADLGDFFQGEFGVIRRNGMPVIEAFDLLGYRILVPGNHDLEHPPEVMRQWRKHFRGDILTGQWTLKGFPSLSGTVVEAGKYRIGVVALGDAGLKKRVSFWRELTYDDEAETVSRAIRELHGRCDAVILLSHISSSNYPVLSRVFRKNPEIDAAVCAHSHKELPGGITRRIPVVQPGPYGSSAVWLKLHFEPDTRKLKYISSGLLRPDEGAGHPAVLKLVRRMAEEDTAGKIRIFPDFSGAENFGTFAASAVRRISGAQAAIVLCDPSVIRKPLDEYQLFRLFPYGNRIALVTADRKIVKQILRRRRKGRGKIFVSGEVPAGEFTLALSDHLLLSEPALRGCTAEITGIFERQAVISALESGKSRRN